jgi:RND family efflux transporter MFP subunit
VTRGSFRSVLRPCKEVHLSSRAAGIVDEVLVLEGETVKAGQAIMALDSNQERAEIAQTEAVVRGSKAEVDRTTAEFERIKSLHTDSIYSEKQYLDAKALLEQARSRYEQGLAALELARVRLANRSITSPIPGIFLKTSKVVGEAVDRYETVARVIDVTSLEMVVFCDSQFFALFKTGQQVDIRVFKSAEDQPMVSGTVFHTDPIVDPSSGTFRVKIKVEPNTQAVAGLSALLIAPKAEPIRGAQ